MRFSHLALAALRAISFRRLADSFLALAGPPFRPPRRPRIRAASRRACSVESSEWEQHLHKLPMYDHFRKISGKFRQADDGTVDGYGIVKFPVRTRVRWRVNRD